MAESSMCLAMDGNEVAALKEALYAQHQLMQKLCVELEKEREASATAASETLSMILRLQGEKAVQKMEANQYRRVTQEKMHHIEQSLAVFEELMYRKEMEITSLYFQLEAYRHKMLSLGFTDLDIEEMGFSKNVPLNNCDSNLYEVGVSGTVKHSISPPAKCCKGSNSMEQCVERGTSYSTKRKTVGDTSHGFGMKTGSKNWWGRMNENEDLSQIHDETRNMYTESVVDDCSSYWKRNEQINKRIQESSHCKSVDEGFTTECILANKELQVSVAGYSESPQDGSRTCLGRSAVSSKPLYDLTTGMRTVLDTSSSISCASSEAEDTENLPDLDSCSMQCIETEMNGNVVRCGSAHDIYEVPQNPISHRFCDPQKQAARKQILEGEKRLEHLDLEKKETVGSLSRHSRHDTQWMKKVIPCAHHEEQSSALPTRVKLDGDWVAMDPKTGVTSSHVEVQELNKRLQLLEDDTRIMKQEASERSEEEMKLLKAICEQLKTVQSQMSSKKAYKYSPMDESLLASAMEAMLSFSI